MQEVGWGDGRPQRRVDDLRGGEHRGGESHMAHLGEMHSMTNPQRHRAGTGYLINLFITCHWISHPHSLSHL